MGKSELLQGLLRLHVLHCVKNLGADTSKMTGELSVLYPDTDRASIYRIIAGLENAGYIKRAAQDDGGPSRYAMTPKGDEMFVMALDSLQRILGNLLSNKEESVK